MTRRSAALLQLASPALPIGGYSYSTGLEWGIESGQVKDEAGAREWVADALALTLACFDGPLMLAALRHARALHPADGRDLTDPGHTDHIFEQLAALNAARVPTDGLFDGPLVRGGLPRSAHRCTADCEARADVIAGGLGGGGSPIVLV
jgi:hypothetical protein